MTPDDYVFVGPSVVFTNICNPRAESPKMDELRPTFKKRGPYWCSLISGVTLGECAFIGIGAVDTKDVSAYALVVGNPAMHISCICKCWDRFDQSSYLKKCSSF